MNSSWSGSGRWGKHINHPSLLSGVVPVRNHGGETTPLKAQAFRLRMESPRREHRIEAMFRTEDEALEFRDGMLSLMQEGTIS